jgi:hypothetical protein
VTFVEWEARIATISRRRGERAREFGEGHLLERFARRYV